MNTVVISSRVRLVFMFGIVSLLVLFTEARTNAQAPAKNPVHLPTDWSHRHLIFSKPADYAQAWELQKEPRYFHQYIRQHMPTVAPASALSGVEEADADEVDEGRDINESREAGLFRRPHVPKSRRKDWAVSLGAGLFMGAGQFPAKFTFDVNSVPSCTGDYVAFTTSVNGTLQIVAFDNLYSSQVAPAGLCGAAGPSVKWAYNTRIAGDVTGRTLTSPVLSLNGTGIAYVESRTNANGGSILHILKWKPGAGAAVQGTIAAPAVPDTTLAAGANWGTCPAANSCVANIILNGKQAVTMSSPFYNYTMGVGVDELYVGDDNGVLHKFTGVFAGTPAEVVAGGWPLTVHAGAILTAPVYDSVSKNIFVADSLGQLSFVKEVGSVTGACSAGSPPCLGAVSQALTGSIVDPPILDASTQKVLVFDGTETSANHGSVFQFDTALTNLSKVTVGIGGNIVAPAADVLHAGTFDDAYFSAGPASGKFYTCGREPGFNNRPAIYQLSFNAAGVLQPLGPTPRLLNLTDTFSLIGDACSPVSELKNGATDRIFFSFAVNANNPTNGTGGTATGCTQGQGCVVMITLGGAWPPAATTAGIAVPFILTGVQTGAGGSSGIVVDNVGAGLQESSIYYTYQVNSTAAVPCNGTTGVGCAVKATQLALK